MSQTKEQILILDLGTSHCKAVLFRRDGTTAGRGRAPYPERYPQPGWVEQEPDDWWAAIGTAARQALAAAAAEPARVAAVGVTGQMHGLLAVDRRGEALTPCLTLRDGRAAAESEEMAAEVGLAEIYGITGGRLAPSMPPAKIRWLRNHRPEVYRRTWAFLAPKDYLRLRLTGEIATEVIDAAGMLLMDVRSRTWSEPLAAAAGSSPDRLPPIRAPWDRAGSLTGDAARLLGLPEATPVYVGAGDDVEFLGHGLVEAGMALEHIGATGSILACVDRPAADPAMVVELYPHVDPSLWLVGGSVNAAGGAVDWACRVLLGRRGGVTPPLQAILEACPDLTPPDRPPLVFLPYLAGERCPIWDPAARGGWLGLALAHERCDLLRAVLQGVAFALRQVLERIEGLAVPVPWLAVQQVGDGPQWPAVRASIYRRPLRLVPTVDATALGTLIVTGIGAGWYGSLAEGVAATGGRRDGDMGRWVEPEAELVERYQRLYELYVEASAASRTLSPRFG